MATDGLIEMAYLKHYLIPVLTRDPYNVVAFVPILPASRVDIFFKIMYNDIILFGIILIFLHAVYYFQSASGGKIKLYEFVRLFLAQSIAHKPQTAVHKIIILTIVATSVKIMNDVLSDIISI